MKSLNRGRLKGLPVDIITNDDPPSLLLLLLFLDAVDPTMRWYCPTQSNIILGDSTLKKKRVR